MRLNGNLSKFVELVTHAFLIVVQGFNRMGFYLKQFLKSYFEPISGIIMINLFAYIME